jgi:putative ABC transport system permease protein
MAYYFRILLRGLVREKLYTFLNIAGLALAIACCIVLGLYLRSELTYDRYNERHEQIFRLVMDINIGGNTERVAVTSPVVGEMLAAQYPEITAYTRFRDATGQGELLITHGADAYYWDNVYFADDNVFEIFTHHVIYGDPATALVDPASVAVSESFARRYFGDANPIGETVATDSGVPIKITLVFADQPENTHLKYDALFSSNVDFLQSPDNDAQRRAALWSGILFTYLVMPEAYDPREFEAISQDFYDRNMASIGESVKGSWRGWLQPLADVHLKSDVNYDEPTGNPYYLYGFAAVGMFILLVACINYVNLATARATRRARAVGIRKILGSGHWPLVGQFLAEAVLFALVAAVCGVVLVEVVLTFSPIETLIRKDLTLDLIGEPQVAAAILGFSLVVGILAGLYPALYLSSWAPLTALVGTNRASRGNAGFRQALVFGQFSISIAVIAGTLLMAAQMHYVQNRALGFAKDNRVMVTVRGVDALERLPTLVNDLAADSRILGISQSQTMMGQTIGAGGLRLEGADGVMQQKLMSYMPVGQDFLDVMDIKLVAGRDFSKRLLTDVGTTYVVNETLARSMGWDEPLGKRMQVNANVGRVIGVVEDFNYKSLHSPVEPFAMFPLDNDFSNVPGINRPFQRRLLVLEIAPGDIPQTLKMLEEKFAEFDPVHPFEFEFVDDSLSKLYVSESSLLELIGIFAGICILIACMGTYGLAAFTTEQRTKEIGIRKVLGASALQVVLLLSRSTLQLILAGAVLGSAVAYLAIDQWLTGFAYRAGINPLIFAAATALAALVAFTTIALQSSSTARADPADSLRYE